MAIMDIRTIQAASALFTDGISRRIFADRTLYGITGEDRYIRSVIATTEEGMALEKTFRERTGQKKLIFGAGDYGKWLATYYKDERFAAFVDNNEKNAGKTVCGIPVITAEEMTRDFRGSCVFVTPRYKYKEIRSQLLDMGWPCGDIVLVGELADSIARKIYFDQPSLPRRDDEVFVDAGAFRGETSRAFFEWCGGSYRSIWCFEPSPATASQCEKNLSGMPGVSVFPAGLYSEKATLGFIEDKTESRIVQDETYSTQKISVTDLDSITDVRGGVTFIKMDIEGAELEALKGAERTIRKFKPSLAISVYHKPGDIADIPALLHGFNPGYRFMLRHYSLSWFDTVLYAVQR